ncbi:MAG TPA: hypothetical protein DDY31_00965 [Lachnospiraceae bacterium]|nr:hypothetical protein [Lachnospiraceae bacterium]
MCGEIINNEINEDYKDVFMYVVDDEKFIYLTDASYTIKFVGNDIGTMNYEIKEYANGEYLRTIAYNDILLEHNKTYYSSIPESVLLDNVVPRPISGDSKIIEATEDDIQDYLGTEIRVENVDLDKKDIVLGIGESTVLAAIISPDDATNQLVTWKSENPNVATVDDNGKVTAVGIGSTTIIATAEDGEYTATCIVTVQKKEDSSNPTVPSPKPGTSPGSKPSVTNRSYRPTTTNSPSVTYEPMASSDVVPTLSPTPTVSPTATPIVVPTTEPTPVITETRNHL